VRERALVVEDPERVRCHGHRDRGPLIEDRELSRLARVRIEEWRSCPVCPSGSGLRNHIPRLSASTNSQQPPNLGPSVTGGPEKPAAIGSKRTNPGSVESHTSPRHRTGIGVKDRVGTSICETTPVAGSIWITRPSTFTASSPPTAVMRRPSVATSV
jgi:hypothetical protein